MIYFPIIIFAFPTFAFSYELLFSMNESMNLLMKIYELLIPGILNFILILILVNYHMFLLCQQQ